MTPATPSLADRLRQRAADLDAGGAHSVCCSRKPCDCVPTPGALVRVVDAVLDEHRSSDDVTCDTCLSGRSDYPEEWEADPWPCETVTAIARALGVGVKPCGDEEIEDGLRYVCLEPAGHLGTHPRTFMNHVRREVD